MDKKQLLERLNELRELMQWNDVNAFKVRAFDRAVEVLEATSDVMERVRAGTLSELDGIGKGLEEAVNEIVRTGTHSDIAQLRKALPEGFEELIRIRGLGPKKVRLLIDELGVRTLADLEYACRENRLRQLKGFGDKLQSRVLGEIEFLRMGEGQVRLDTAFSVAEQVFERVQERVGEARYVAETGELRRRMETLRSIDLLVEASAEECAALESELRDEIKSPIPIRLYPSTKARWGNQWFETSTPEWMRKRLTRWSGADEEHEEKLFEAEGLPWIPPECRDDEGALNFARDRKIDTLMDSESLRGVFHVHTTASDGANSLEEMIEAAADWGFDYVGISDHSVSAFYAQGLSREALLKQRDEIQRLQDHYPEIRIFWGIESDILADGSLDYDTKTLKLFDFVIASIHSRFQMDSETMTQRLIEAIRNPHTTMLGHPTGRLLLGRRPYAFDVERVIREAAEHGVAIEINSHPSRVDLDWRYGSIVRESGCWVSINPDAHAVEGYEDVRYGIAVARKAWIPRDQILNTRTVDEVEKWFKARRS